MKRLNGSAQIKGALAALLCLLVGAANANAAVPREFFGVMPQTALTTEDIERMGQAKVGTLRFEIHWDGIDPGPGDDYNFSSIDFIVGEAAKQNIRPLPFIFGTPKWVTDLDSANCGGDCRIYAPRSPAELAAWRTFLGDLVGRYGPDGAFWDENPEIPKKPITDWQIWNEQNSPSFYGPKPNVKKYAKLLDASHTALTTADPNAGVILGGMFGTPLGGRKPGISSWKFLEKLYKVKGAKKDFEGVAPHPYAAKLSKVSAQVDLMREAMKKGGDKQADMWITELGWASSGPNNPLVRGNKGQAQRLKEAFKYFKKKRRAFNVHTVIWYSWRDNPDTDVGLCAWCPGSGLVSKDLVAKPSLKAFTSFTGGS